MGLKEDFNNVLKRIQDDKRNSLALGREGKVRHLVQNDDKEILRFAQDDKNGKLLTILPACSPSNPSPSRGRSKAGFTLAEVLITLGIIGIVAAMTMPALITNMRHKTASARLKKFYSTMKQMLLQAEDEHGSVNNWNNNLPYPEFYDTYFLPYIKATKEGDAKDTIYFQDGSSMQAWRGGGCMDLIYDINGKTSPNKMGYDQFRFLICEPSTGGAWCDDEGFCPYRKKTMKGNRAELLKQCKANAGYCSALLEIDHWEFLPDYPY